MRRIFEFTKPLIGAFIIIALLQVTGLFGDVAALTQQAALSTGLMNVSLPIEDKNNEDFDFGFTLKDSLGNSFNADQFKGKVIFLNLWATWCGPCRAEMPAIHKLYAKVKDERIVFIMLSIDKDQAAQKVKAYVRKNKYTFPVYRPSGYLTDQLNVPSIPTTFVIAKDGKIVMKEVGTKNYNTDKFRKFLIELAAK
jgi:thiol-disulfide isomerase/thioredoxin